MTKAKLEKAVELNGKIEAVTAEINRLEKNEIVNAFCSIKWSDVDRKVLDECKKVLIKAMNDELKVYKKDFQAI